MRIRCREREEARSGHRRPVPRRVARWVARGAGTAALATLALPALRAQEAIRPAEGIPVIEPPEPLPIPVVTGDPKRGAQFFTGVCFACHGPDGSGRQELGSPSLHQQDPWYLVAQLGKFRAGIRGAHPDDLHGAQMRPMALTLPDEQALSDVALYVTSLDGARPPKTLTGDAKRGLEIYTNICVVCHGPDAKGLPQFRSPALAGQADWYVEKQMHKFRTGVRGADPRDGSGLQMKAIMTALPDDAAVRDVAAYIGTLP